MGRNQQGVLIGEPVSHTTEFWVDPQGGVSEVLLMQYLPFCDETAIRTLRDLEAEVYKQLAPPR